MKRTFAIVLFLLAGLVAKADGGAASVQSDVSRAQEPHLESVVRVSEKEWDTSALRSAYFRQLSDKGIVRIVPHALYDSGGYVLYSDVRSHDRLVLRAGGNLSTSLPLQGYIGVDYDHSARHPLNAWADVQIGRVYNALCIGTWAAITPRLYLRGEMVAQQFNYYEDNRFFYYDAPMTGVRQREYYLRIAGGTPLAMHTRFEAGSGVAFLHDRYRMSSESLLTEQSSDHSRYWATQFYATFEGNTLNRPMYPTTGQYWCVILRAPASTERSASEAYPENNTVKPLQWWVQGKGRWEGYFPLGRHFTLGAEGEGVWSSRNMLGNYTATVIRSPHYAPTVHARSTYNSAYSAKQYVAAGVKPIVLFTPRWQLRMEGYVFAPLFDIECYSDNTAYYSEFMPTVRFITEASVVYTFNRGAASLYANRYSSPANDWNVGINLGILMFHDKFID